MKSSPRVLRRRIPADLIDAIYRVEGWKKIEGEARIRRCNAVYDITRDATCYIATRKET